MPSMDSTTAAKMLVLSWVLLEGGSPYWALDTAKSTSDKTQQRATRIATIMNNGSMDEFLFIFNTSTREK